MARCFTEDAVVLWPNTGEGFTLEEYLQANCAYPGRWEGEVERVALDGSVSVARVWAGASVFRAVSFYQWQGDRILRLEEYWGDVAPAPAWRREMGVGRSVSPEDAHLPDVTSLSPALLGRCGFSCGVCPSYTAGSCPGCESAHSPGDCFTRDCIHRRSVSYCPQCGQFPCGELLRREKSTVLDRDWLRWKQKP